MEGDHVKCLSLDGRIIIQGCYRIEDGEAWSGLIWLGTGMGGRVLVNAVITFNKMQGIT